MKYYAVKTTGIYCRPGCKSRAPLPKNVEYFESAADAERASYRPCKRCRPNESVGERDERFVELCRAIESAEQAPTLAQLAAMAHMSEFHLQRRFKAAIGVSPKQYAQTIKRERLRASLNAAAGVTQAMHESGAAGSPHDLGMTPSQFRRGGEDASICYTIAASSIGSVLVAATPRGICRVDIADDARVLEERLRAEYPRAAIDAADSAICSAASTIVAYLAGTGPWPLLPLDVRATAFQARVWEVLRSIAPGTTVSYAKLAEMIGSPKAARAVARACATNPAALLIPCHRIVPQSGGTGGYRWAPKRKERLLEIERGLARR